MVRLSSIVLCLVCAFLLATNSHAVGAQESDTTSKSETAHQSSDSQQVPIGPNPATLSVMYVGQPRSDRMVDTVGFLTKHFACVGTCNIDSDTKIACAGFDVVVLDWSIAASPIQPPPFIGPIVYSRSQHLPTLLDSLASKPTVFMGCPDQYFFYETFQRPDLAVLNVQDFAHDTNTDHAIFRGPLSVELTSEQISSPPEYFLSAGAKSVGELLEVWRVQQQESKNGVGFDRRLFSPTADVEAIACGLNEFRRDQVTIGRNGNKFIWGFSASPTQMTESAQNAFVNSICYIKNFEDKQWQSPDVQLHERDIFLHSLYGTRRLNEDHFKASLSSYRNLQIPMSVNKAEEITKDPTAFLKEYIKKDLEPILARIPRDTLEQAHGDYETLLKHFAQNLEYLYVDDQFRYRVDTDAQSLGLSNRAPDFLERCVALLDSHDNKEKEKGERLIGRYVAMRQSMDIEQWRDWYTINKDDLAYDSLNEKYFHGLRLDYNRHIAVPPSLLQQIKFVPIGWSPFPMTMPVHASPSGSILRGNASVPQAIITIPASSFATPPHQAMEPQTDIDSTDPAATTIPSLPPLTAADTAELTAPTLPPTFRQFVPGTSTVKPWSK